MRGLLRQVRIATRTVRRDISSQVSACSGRKAHAPPEGSACSSRSHIDCRPSATDRPDAQTSADHTQAPAWSTLACSRRLTALALVAMVACAMPLSNVHTKVSSLWNKRTAKGQGLTCFMEREYDSRMEQGQAMCIKTIPELVRALGGTTAVSRMCHVIPSAVSNWIAHDEIPRGHHLLIYLEIKRRGLDVCPTVFGTLPQDLIDVFVSDRPCSAA